MFAYTRAQEEVRLQLLFERAATALAQRLQHSFDSYLNVLYGVEGLYASTGSLHRHAFHTFVQRLHAHYPGLQALSWDRRVTDAQRQVYEQAIQHEGVAGFAIMEQNAQRHLVQAARRPEYVVVPYIEPYVGNGRALGFDVASTPDRLEALWRARDTRQPTATGRLMLVQETGRQFGLLVFLPIYDHGLPPATLEERRQNLHGYATGVFQIGDMVEASLPDLARQGLELRIEDEAAPPGRQVLYDSRGWTPEGSGPVLDQGTGENPSGMHWQTTVVLAGRRWGLRFTPARAFLADRQSLQPWTVLGGGLVFTSALRAFLLIVTGRATVIEQLMAERTAQLDPSRRMEAEAEQRRRETEVLAELTRTINATLDFVEWVAARTGLHIHVDSSVKERLPPAVETAVYRIMQEGLTNITKHAAASHVHLQLWREAGMVHGRLHDDGSGFAVDQVVGQTGRRGLGLLGIQERLEALGGTLRITLALGHGTTLGITLPVEPG